MMSAQIEKPARHISSEALRDTFSRASLAQIPAWAVPQLLNMAQWTAFWTDCCNALTTLFDAKSANHGAVLKGTRGPVLVLPGFFTGDDDTQELREDIHRQGYSVYPWNHGVNAGPNDQVVQYEEDLLDKIYRAEGRPVILIGHSQGGMAALALARAFPEKVRQVITLGSPHKIGEEPVTVPVTSIYSHDDEVVHDWRDCVHPDHASVEVGGSHVDLVRNPKAFASILQGLDQVERAQAQTHARTGAGLGMAPEIR